MKRLVLTTALALAVAAASVSCDKVKPPQPELKTDAPATGTTDTGTKKLELGLNEAQHHLDQFKLVARESWSQMTETFKMSLDKLKGAVKGAIEDRF